jgi:hypothetical protein
MKAVKLTFTIAALILIGTMSFAETRVSKAIIHQTSENLVKVKAEICDLDDMRVEITNEEGDVVFADKLSNGLSIASKTYDFSETKVGGYFVTVYCNDRVLETTVIGNGKVAKQDAYYFVIN